MTRPVEPRRRWTLASARELLPEVRGRTEKAITEVERLLAERDAEPDPSAGRSAYDARVREVVSRWVRGMEALGVEVKGAWLVDFDTGNGYLCWRWPESALEYFHGYDEGFAGRVRIQ